MNARWFITRWLQLVAEILVTLLLIRVSMFKESVTLAEPNKKTDNRNSSQTTSSSTA